MKNIIIGFLMMVGVILTLCTTTTTVLASENDYSPYSFEVLGIEKGYTSLNVGDTANSSYSVNFNSSDNEKLSRVAFAWSQPSTSSQSARTDVIIYYFTKSKNFTAEINNGSEMETKDNSNCKIYGDYYYFLTSESYMVFTDKLSITSNFAYQPSWSWAKNFSEHCETSFLNYLDGKEIDTNFTTSIGSSETQTLKCPSDALMLYMDYMGSDYGEIEGVAPQLYFYPEDVLGKKIVVNFTYNYNTYIRRKMTTLEQIKHPTYCLSDKECPKCDLQFTRKIEIEIPSNLDEIPTLNSFDTILDIQNLFYDSEKNKIVIRDYPKYADLKNEIHNCIKNYSFKIGSPVCVDCEPFSGNAPYKNKYKHIGKAVSVNADCQLFQDNNSTPVFKVSLKINSNSNNISIYSNPDDNSTSEKNEDNDSIIFSGTNQDGTKNDYGNSFSDSEWDNLFHNDNYASETIDDMSFSESVSWLKGLIKDLKDFPTFFAEFFSYIPLSKVVGITIMAIIVVGLIVGFLKLIIS